MKPSIDLDDDYFLKYKDKPVRLRPFNIRTRRLGEKIVGEISTLLGNTAEVELRGSTAYEILGKGDIEVGIYPKDSNAEVVRRVVIDKYGKPSVAEDDYVKFDYVENGVSIEIMIMTGYVGEMDRRLRSYLMSHGELLEEYETIKVKYSFSRIDYNREKSRFFRKVERMIPD